ncbi:hypothetical protein [Citromicrobium sp. WPS32]|uniref:hypothetical protein n=1 Tax=Citromicrobium sp. WPS32 TaxID=1634517 RepID=UPI0018D0E156|nr:hypothetical protein [Citromicrobium sp. WPS32]
MRRAIMALAALMLGAPTIAQDSIFSAAETAEHWSNEPSRVGIVLYWGPNNATTTHSVCSQFVEAFRSRDILARCFTQVTESPGAALSFHIGPVERGPYSIPEAGERAAEIVRLSQARDKL